MTPKFRFCFAALMSLILSFLMTAWVTWINLGFIQGFVGYWLRAFVIAWPAAAIISYVFGPWVQRVVKVLLKEH